MTEGYSRAKNEGVQKRAFSVEPKGIRNVGMAYPMEFEVHTGHGVGAYGKVIRRWRWGLTGVVQLPGRGLLCSTYGNGVVNKAGWGTLRMDVAVFHEILKGQNSLAELKR